jgi:hypothetical protein
MCTGTGINGPFAHIDPVAQVAGNPGFQGGRRPNKRYSVTRGFNLLAWRADALLTAKTGPEAGNNVESIRFRESAD